MTNDATPITDSPAAEQKAASVDKAQEAAVVMENPGDGDCDSIHVFWNTSTHQLDDWRA